ncbi:MAG: hypothetical protein HYR56_06560 [Acidobacteria bacterium]|nr:hypothetical protein [Acidobacteriota bacterium]MBI3426611.1 hypothetical protein [Acidobacteriota bacterium]
MKRPIILIALLTFLTVTAFAQTDQLTGRWEGETNSMQGKRPTTVIFKKEGAGYTGRTAGLRPNTEAKLYAIKVEGAKVTAKADFETPQATVTIDYTFTLAGDALTGEGALDFGGNAIKIEVSLKRVSTDTEGALFSAAQQQQTPQPGQQQARPQQRQIVEQPQQKQSLDYFVGAWTYKYVGRESALAPAPREGTMTFTKNADGKSATGVGTGKHDAGVYKESMNLVFDEATKLLTVTETTSAGVKLNSKGDWRSPISIRFSYDAITVKGQKLQLRRTLSIVAAHSFTITDELAEDGGPFVRLGNAVYSKVGAN